MAKKLSAETKSIADKVSVGTLDLSALTIEAKRGRSRAMPKRRKTNYQKPDKTYWQTLNSERFIKVVNKILKKEYILIK